MKKKNRALVGAFVVGGILLFGLGLFMIGDRRQLFTESIELYAEFDSVAGLQTGGTVRVAGVAAGEVVAVEVPPSPDQHFRVRFRIIEDLQPIVRTDSVATIQTDGLVGDMFLQVDSGTVDAPIAETGDTIQSREPFELADLMEQARQTIQTVSSTVTDLQDDVEAVLTNVRGIAEKTDTLIAEVGPDVERAVSASSALIVDTQEVMAGIRAGRGTVGKLFHDEALYGDVRGSIDDVRAAAANIRETSADIRRVVAQARESDMIDNVAATMENVREVSGQAKDLLEDLKPTGDEAPSLVAEVRQTLSSANEAMADFAENAEALKRNFLFRGFFRQRGFYDLDKLSIADYKSGQSAPGWPQERAWLAARDIFRPVDDGVQVTEEGRRQIEQAIAPMLEHANEDPIVVEGYAAEGEPSQNFLLSLERGTAVRDFLVERFGLNPNYVGVMPMGAVQARDDSGFWEGVALVRYDEKKPKGKGNSGD